MNSNQVHEIVLFRFDGTVDAQAQRMAMEVLGTFIRAQPGFVSRASYHDVDDGSWVDLVTWATSEAAENAMTKGQTANELAGVFQVIDSASLRIGHYLRVI